jgi:polar amino acid transport system substrate-binding protein
MMTNKTTLKAAAILWSFMLAGAAWPAAAADVQAVPELAALLPASIRDAGVLRIAIPDVSRPKVYVENGEIKGMWADLAREMTGVLGIKADLQSVPFSAALPGLQAGRTDISFGDFYITAARLEVADFISYWRDFSTFVVRADTGYAPAAIADACGHKLGAIAGSVELETLTKNILTCTEGDVEVSAFPSGSAALLALSSGRIDAVLTGRGAAASAMAADKSLAVSGELGGGPTSIAIARNDSAGAVGAALKGALDHMIETGRYKEILDANGTAYGAVTETNVYTVTSEPPKYGF